MSTAHFPILLTAVPLTFAALCPVLGLWNRRLCPFWAVLGAALTAMMAFSLIGTISPSDPASYHMAGWEPPWGIEVRIDFVGLFFSCTIASIGLLILVYSRRYIEHELLVERIPYFYSLYLLAFSALLGFACAGDLFNMFVFMEIFSVTCYALVAVTGEGQALRASFKYLLMGAVSSVAVLLGIAFVYGAAGSLNMADISSRLAETPHVSATGLALILFMAGFAVKAAVFPVHVWLPDAHSLAPSPVSALLSALVIKVGALGVFRVLFSIFGGACQELLVLRSAAAEVFAWAAALSIVVGSAMAILQTNLKLMIAYSSVSHIGYILMGLCMLNPWALQGGLYNILAHAMGKACLFLVAGIFLYKHGVSSIGQLKGLGRTMPVTAGAFGLAALSIVGLPPSAGFMAKWHILQGCMEEGRYAFLAMALMGTLLSAIYCFRVIYYLFFLGMDSPRGRIDEAPASMVAPVVILAMGTLFFGVFAFLVTPSLHDVAGQVLMP